MCGVRYVTEPIMCRGRHTASNAGLYYEKVQFTFFYVSLTLPLLMKFTLVLWQPIPE